MNKPRKNRLANRTLRDSFRDAINGFLEAVKTGRNMRVHLSAAFYVLVFAFWMDFSKAESAILLLTIAVVITAEMFNTSIEDICDFNQTDYSPQIRVIKDVAAGAVLVSAVAAAVVGIILFFNRKFLLVLMSVVRSPIKLIFFLLSLVLLAFFVFWGPEKIYTKLSGKPIKENDELNEQ